MVKERLYGYVIVNTREIRHIHRNFWESVTYIKGYNFNCYIDDDYEYYYGLDKDGNFDNYNENAVKNKKLTIITLEQAKNMLKNSTIREVW